MWNAEEGLLENLNQEDEGWNVEYTFLEFQMLPNMPPPPLMNLFSVQWPILKYGHPTQIN